MPSPRTVGEALTAAGERLLAASDSPRIDALRLLELAVGRDVAWLFAHGEARLEPDQTARFEASLARRALGEPLAYIAGNAGFYGRTFAVSPAVLVPRPESEHVIAIALAELRVREGGAGLRICDVGTGSGSLAITLALELPGARVVAIDVSPSALEVAARNANVHHVGSRVRLALGDLFEPLTEGERFDCIVANLPYVATRDLAPAPDATSFEPRLALDGGVDGLAVYRRLLAQAPQRLANDGLLLMEAGPDTASALAQATRDAFGPRAGVGVVADYAERERVVIAKLGKLLPS